MPAATWRRMLTAELLELKAWSYRKLMACNAAPPKLDNAGRVFSLLPGYGFALHTIRRALPFAFLGVPVTCAFSRDNVGSGARVVAGIAAALGVKEALNAAQTDAATLLGSLPPRRIALAVVTGPATNGCQRESDTGRGACGGLHGTVRDRNSRRPRLGTNSIFAHGAQLYHRTRVVRQGRLALARQARRVGSACRRPPAAPIGHRGQDGHTGRYDRGLPVHPARSRFESQRFCRRSAVRLAWRLSACALRTDRFKNRQTRPCVPLRQPTAALRAFA